MGNPGKLIGLLKEELRRTGNLQHYFAPQWAVSACFEDMC
jgi:hypothetical protein